MRIMKSHVNDLSEQNEVLVAIVEDVEEEANDRVASLEDKLQKSAADTKVCRRYLTHERYLVLADTPGYHVIFCLENFALGYG